MLPGLRGGGVNTVATAVGWVVLGGLALAALPVALLALAWLWGRFAPAHWALSGPQWRRRAQPSRVFRSVNLAGRHVTSFRRLAALGPWSWYVARYAPGNVDEPGGEVLP